MKILPTLAAAAFTLMSFGSNASMIYTFDVSDTSTSGFGGGNFIGVSYIIQFKDGVNYNNVQASDIYNFGFVSPTNSGSTSDFYTTSTVHRLFSLVGGNVFLNVGKAIDDRSSLLHATFNNMTLLAGQEEHHGLYFRDEFGVHNTAYESPTTVSMSFAGVGVEVPEPSTLAILGLGIMGLVSRRFKKQ